jgi:hypothetical protein
MWISSAGGCDVDCGADGCGAAALAITTPPRQRSSPFRPALRKGAETPPEKPFKGVPEFGQRIV